MYGWLDGRTVFPFSLGLAHALSNHPGLMEKESFVNDFYTLYIDMTVLLWPAEWKVPVRMIEMLRAECQCLITFIRQQYHGWMRTYNY